MRRISREGGIGVAVSALTVGAMAIDHLIGTEDEPGDDPGLADPTAFLISMAISLLLAALLFGVVVRRAARDDPGRVAIKALVYSLLAVPAMGASGLSGCPFPWPVPESPSACSGARARGADLRRQLSRSVYS